MKHPETTLSAGFHSVFTFSILATSLALATLAVPDASAQTPPRGPDFDNNWFDDIAISASQENWNSVPGAGMVSIGYGSSTGLGVPAGYQGYFAQNVAGIADSADPYDRFGSALAWGDFNGDCFDDLVIGAHLEDVNGHDQAGAIHVIYGTANGLSATGSQFFHRDTPSMQGDLHEDAGFGADLAAGDFDGDGFDDVAISATSDFADGKSNAGSVQILYGSANGITTIGDQYFTRANLGFESLLYFAYSLAAGDFDCDGRDDLAIGDPYADPGGVGNGGDVMVLYGTPNGLSASGLQVWYQGNNGIDGINEPHDYFGTSLATGNWNGDTFGGRNCMDLAVGVEIESFGTIANSGSVHVIYGSSSQGLQTSSPADQVFTQETARVPDTVEALDNFGHALVAGRFDNDAYDDLAIGIPGEDITDNGGVVNAGAVLLLPGSANGLTGSGSVQWTQNTPGISYTAEEGDYFGTTLGYVARPDWNGTTLLIGVTGKDFGPITGAGLVNACTLDNNSPNIGLSTEDALDQSDFGGSLPETGDGFGNFLIAPRHVPFRCPS